MYTRQRLPAVQQPYHVMNTLVECQRSLTARNALFEEITSSSKRRSLKMVSSLKRRFLEITGNFHAVFSALHLVYNAVFSRLHLVYHAVFSGSRPVYKAISRDILTDIDYRLSGVVSFTLPSVNVNSIGAMLQCIISSGSMIPLYKRAGMLAMPSSRSEQERAICSRSSQRINGSQPGSSHRPLLAHHRHYPDPLWKLDTASSSVLTQSRGMWLTTAGLRPCTCPPRRRGGGELC